MRFLFYSPDSYGLGHVRRTLSLTEHLLDAFEGASALVLTGAPRNHFFAYPSRCDYVKLPSITKDIDGHYVTRDISLPLKRTVKLRGRLIKEAASSFRPDIVFVDHSPNGLCGEVLDALSWLRRKRPKSRRILGLRDVIDEPDVVRSAWDKGDVVETLRREYDAVAVYGQRDVFDPIEAYGFPQDVAAKTHFVGYIPRHAKTAPDGLVAQYAPRTGKLVVITVGGGGDGNLVLRAFLEGYSALGVKPPFEVVALTGPLMSPGKRARFREMADGIAGLTLLERHEDPPALYRAANFVVSMGGYNSIIELACADARALIVARTFPRREQFLRAKILEERGVVRCVPMDQAEPSTLMRETLAGLQRLKPAKHWGLNMTGLTDLAGLARKLSRRRREGKVQYSSAGAGQVELE